jgi:hypothetical protein
MSENPAPAPAPAAEPPKKLEPFSVAPPGHNWAADTGPEPMPAKADNSPHTRLASVFTVAGPDYDAVKEYEEQEKRDAAAR